MVMNHTIPSTECPYSLAYAALRTAETEGARVEWHPSPGAFRFVDARTELSARLLALSGAHAFDVVTDADEHDAQLWASLASTLPSCFRYRREGHSVRVVHLSAPTRLALARLAAAPSRAARDMLVTPVAVLRELPVPWTIVLERVPSELARKEWGARRVRFVVSTSKAAYQAARAQGLVVWGARELEAAALGAELERAYPRDLDQWLDNKARGEWLITPERTRALDVRGVTEATRSTWALGRVLDALEVELVNVDMHEVKGGGT
jgi:hypothetical protein